MPAKTLGEGSNPSGLCQCGCGQPTSIARKSDRATGTVNGTPTRYLRGHHNRKGPDFLIDENGCWIWQQYVTPQGYGIGRFGDERQIAHRGMYEQIRGEIPEGMHLDHLCRVPACVNPDHLEPVSPVENTHRSRLVKLSDEDVRAIRASGEPGVTLAKRFGVKPSYITKIRNGRARVRAGREKCSCCGGSGWVDPK